jgi:hypothetical protein
LGSSEDLSSVDESEEDMVLRMHEQASYHIIEEGKRKMFIDLMKDWRAESAKGMENSIPR